MKQRLMAVLALALLFPALPAAAGALDGWEYYKPVRTGGSAKYKTFFIDNDVYRHARPDLHDLRIVDEKGQAVPFYIVKGYSFAELKEISYDAVQADFFKKKHDTYIDFRILPLREETDITVNKLVFTLPPGDILKNIEIYGSRDGITWEPAGGGQLWRVGYLEKNELVLAGVKKYGYYRVRIPEDLSDTRLGLRAAMSNREVSVVEFKKNFRPAYQVRQENKQTYVIIKNPDRLRVSAINLEVEENFQRSFTVFDGEIPVGNLGKQELYNLQFQDFRVSNTGIQFEQSPVMSESITVRIDDRDNRPLNIKGLTAEYLLDRVVFESSGSPEYRLYFGNPEAARPSYEIELYRQHVDREPKDEVVLGSLEKTAPPAPPPTDSGINFKLIFNIVIGLVSLLLVIFLARKISLQE